MDRGRGAAFAIEPADRSKSRRPQPARGRTSSWLFLSDRVEGLSRGTFDWPLAIPCLDTRFNARRVSRTFFPLHFPQLHAYHAVRPIRPAGCMTAPQPISRKDETR